MEQAKRFRPNVCVVLADEQAGRVLVFRRVDAVLSPHRWQFPQGGLRPGEAPADGMRRELREEIGTDDVQVLRRLERPIRYEYPPEVLARLAAGDPAKAGFHGQEQHWFLARLLSGTEAIRFDRHPHPEFDAFRWVAPAEAVAQVVPFKQGAYRQALAALGLLHPGGDAPRPA